jgi:hypothetical protein
MKHKNKRQFFYIRLFCLLIICISRGNFSIGQTSSTSKIFNKYIKSSSKTSDAYNAHLKKTNKKYLKKYFRNENKLHTGLCKKDPALADHLFSISNDPLFYHQNDPNILTLINTRSAPKEYFPKLDSLKCSLSYLNQSKDTLKGVNREELSEAEDKTQRLDRNFTTSDKLQQYFRQRKLVLKESLSSHPELKNSIEGMDKVNYYYHEQVSEYKKLLSRYSKVDESAMQLLNGNSAFKRFIEKNGMLSVFSKIPSNWGKSTVGLQTIAQTKGMMQKSITALGQNPKEIIEERMKPMTESMNKLKSGDYGSITNAADVPSFKPNPFKSKRFIDRIEFGTNFQVSQSNTYFPATTNIALQVAYKLNSDLSTGIGASYILGMGKGWNQIQFTNQGIGLQSFIDRKIAGIIYISGGFEKNTLPPTSIQKENGDYSWHWQSCALLGLKCKYSLSGKLSPTMSLQYDFLYDSHIPNTSPFVYKIGWVFGSK